MPNYIIGPSFRFSKLKKCYMFLKEKSVVLNYAPEEENKYIMNGAIHITDGFPVLSKTIFENGIDCAFDIEHEDNEAFIFSGNQCAKIKYSPHSTNSKILLGPIPIADMFPCLKETVFENGIDAAINFVKNNVHIFKGNETALLNYDTGNFCETSKFATNHLSCLFGTVFEASHTLSMKLTFSKENIMHISILPDLDQEVTISSAVE